MFDNYRHKPVFPQLYDVRSVLTHCFSKAKPPRSENARIATSHSHRYALLYKHVYMLL